LSDICRDYLNLMHFFVIKFGVPVVALSFLGLIDCLWPKFELVSHECVVAERFWKFLCVVNIDLKVKIFLPNEFRDIINLKFRRK